MAKHFGIDFSWILIDLGGQVGAKLESSIDQKSINKLNIFQTPFQRKNVAARGGGALDAHGVAGILGPPGHNNENPTTQPTDLQNT